MKPDHARALLNRAFDRLGEIDPDTFHTKIGQYTRGGFPTGMSSGRGGELPLPLPDRQDQILAGAVQDFDRFLIVAARALDRLVQTQRSVVEIYAAKPDFPLHRCSIPGCPNYHERGTDKHLVPCDRCRQWEHRHGTPWTPKQLVHDKPRPVT